MPARFATRLLFLVWLVAGVTGCGSGTDDRVSPPPRLPTDAPVLGTATGAAPLRTSESSAGAGSDAQSRLDRLEADLQELRTKFKSAEPAINRLVRVEGDISALLNQMERVIAAKSQDVGPQRLASSPSPIASAAIPPAPIASLSQPSSQSAAASLPLAPSGTLSLVPRSAQPASAQTSSPTPPSPAAAPTPAITAPPPASPSAPLPATPSPNGTRSSAVHLASYRSLEQAEQGWALLTRRFKDELINLNGTVSTVDLPQGRFYRLQAAALSWKEAEALCARLASRGQFCAPTLDDGETIVSRGQPIAQAVIN